MRGADGGRSQHNTTDLTGFASSAYYSAMENTVRVNRTEGGVQSVDRALGVLLAFLDGATLLGPTELGQRLGLSKSAVHALLVSLERAGFVYRDNAAGKYGLGPRLAQLAGLWAEADMTRSLARPTLEALARELDETVFLGVIKGGRAVYADRIESRQRLRVIGEIGEPVPLHATALGKVFLAHLPPLRLQAVLAGPLEAYTRHTIVDPDRLLVECEAIRTQGYAVSDGERDELTLGVAAPVRNPPGAVHAAITAVGPRGRFDLARSAEQVVRAAAEVSRRLDPRGDQDR